MSADAINEAVGEVEALIYDLRKTMADNLVILGETELASDT